MKPPTYNCPVKTKKCEGNTLKDCRMCEYFDYEVFLAENKVRLIKTRPTNCPNCGAVIHDGKCDYCGTEVGA